MEAVRDVNSSVQIRTGRWSFNEQLVFLSGLRRWGKGQWKLIGKDIPTRSLVQIKSHAQKVLKKADMGEDVFRILKTDIYDPSVDYTKAILAESREEVHQRKKNSKSARATRRKPALNGRHAKAPKRRSFEPRRRKVSNASAGHQSSGEDDDAVQALSFLHQSPINGPIDPVSSVPVFSLNEGEVHGSLPDGIASGGMYDRATAGSLSHPPHVVHEHTLQPDVTSLPPQRGYREVPLTSRSLLAAETKRLPSSLSCLTFQSSIKNGAVKASGESREEDAEILLSLLASKNSAKKKDNSLQSCSSTSSSSTSGEGLKKRIRIRSPLFEENGQNIKASPPLDLSETKEGVKS